MISLDLVILGAFEAGLGDWLKETRFIFVILLVFCGGEWRCLSVMGGGSDQTAYAVAMTCSSKENGK